MFTESVDELRMLNGVWMKEIGDREFKTRPNTNEWCSSFWNRVKLKNSSLSPKIESGFTYKSGSTRVSSLVHLPLRSAHVERNHECLRNPTGYVRYNRGVFTTTNGSTLGISCSPSLLVIPDTYRSCGRIGVSV